MEQIQKEEGIKLVNSIIDKWTSKYSKKVVMIQKIVGGATQFLAEFSLPTPKNPIPAAAVKMIFNLKKVEGGETDVTYTFDNTSLIHTPGRTIRLEMMERYIDRQLE